MYTGTPGIGKSIAVFYSMYELRSKYGAKIDIVYQHERTGMQYLFRGDGEVLESRTAFNSFDEILFRRTTIYMVDGKGVHELHSLVTLFAFCSPDARNWKEVLKARGVRLRYLPVWSWQQLLAARQLIDPHVSEPRLAELYTKWGGIPRVVLEKADKDSYQHYYMDSALGQARSLGANIAAIKWASASDEDSSKILHYAAGPDFIRRQEVFASQWVAEEVVRSAGQQAERQIYEFLAAHDKDPQTAGLRNQVSEALAHKVLQRGGTFRVRPLGTCSSQPAGGSPTSEAWPAMVLEEFSKVTDIGSSLESGHAGNLYMVPTARNNKAFNALRPPRDALQMTVSLNHPISHAGKTLPCQAGASNSFMPEQLVT